MANPNMSLNLLERYKSYSNSDKSCHESFVAILSLVFSVASIILNSKVTGHI